MSGPTRLASSTAIPEDYEDRVALVRELRAKLGNLECDAGLTSAANKDEYIKHLAPQQLVELVVGLYKAIDETLATPPPPAPPLGAPSSPPSRPGVGGSSSRADVTNNADDDQRRRRSTTMNPNDSEETRNAPPPLTSQHLVKNRVPGVLDSSGSSAMNTKTRVAQHHNNSNTSDEDDMYATHPLPRPPTEEKIGDSSPKQKRMSNASSHSSSSPLLSSTHPMKRRGSQSGELPPLPNGSNTKQLVNETATTQHQLDDGPKNVEKEETNHESIAANATHPPQYQQTQGNDELAMSGGTTNSEETPLVPVVLPPVFQQSGSDGTSGGFTANRRANGTPPPIPLEVISLQSNIDLDNSLNKQGSSPSPRSAGPMSADDGSFAAWGPNPVINLNMSGSEASETERDPMVLSHGARASVSEEGYECINEYAIIDEIGRGQYGSVQLAINQTSDEVRAIKKLPRKVIKKKAMASSPTVPEPLKSTDSASLASPLTSTKVEDIDIAREVAIMKKMRHKNVVALYEVIDDVEDGYLYLVMQYADKGALFELKSDFTCDTLSEEKVRDYLRQLVSGLSYLKKHKVVHRDIKPDNLLLTKDGDVLIADFGMSEMLNFDRAQSFDDLDDGLSTEFEEGARRRRRSSGQAAGSPIFSPKAQPTQTIGTPAFMAPEVISGDYDVVSSACDVWSLGVTLFCMLWGRAPFKGRNVRATMALILETEPTYPEDADPVWVDLVKGMLQKDPEERTSLQALRRHPKINAGRARSMSLTPQGGVLTPMTPGFELTQFDLESAIGSKQPAFRRLDLGSPTSSNTPLTSPDGRLTASLNYSMSKDQPIPPALQAGAHNGRPGGLPPRSPPAGSAPVAVHDPDAFGVPGVLRLAMNDDHDGNRHAELKSTPPPHPDD